MNTYHYCASVYIHGQVERMLDGLWITIEKIDSASQYESFRKEVADKAEVEVRLIIINSLTLLS